MPRRRFLGEEAAVPEEVRCRRSDGRKWRCPQRAMHGAGFCEHHYGLMRRNLGKLKASLEAESPPSPRRRPIRQPRPRPEECPPPDPPPRKRRRDGNSPREELMTAAVKREMEKRKKEAAEEEEEGEVTRDLPKGVMTISSGPVRILGNAGPPLDQKLGFDQGLTLRRCIRSKNAQPLPVVTVKKFPCSRGLGRGRRRVCHRCGESKVLRMIRCSSCRKGFFCSICIKKWYTNMSILEVKKACPICRGFCNCMTCSHCGDKDGRPKDFANGHAKYIKVSYARYLICQLLPVLNLKQISQEEFTELEIEARSQGRRLSGVQLQVAECGRSHQLYCNYCENSIVNFLRSCSKCSYKLCVTCCQKFRRERILEEVAMDTFMYLNKRKSRKHGGEGYNGMKQKLSTGLHPDNSSLSSELGLLDFKSENSDCCISCPSKELGGCGDDLLNLLFMLPFGWSQELGISAEQIAFSYNCPERLDVSPHASSGIDMNDKDGKSKINLQEAFTT